MKCYRWENELPRAYLECGPPQFRHRLTERIWKLLFTLQPVNQAQNRGSPGGNLTGKSSWNAFIFSVVFLNLPNLCNDRELFCNIINELEAEIALRNQLALLRKQTERIKSIRKHPNHPAARLRSSSHPTGGRRGKFPDLQFVLKKEEKLPRVQPCYSGSRHFFSTSLLHFGS